MQRMGPEALLDTRKTDARLLVGSDETERKVPFGPEVCTEEARHDPRKFSRCEAGETPELWAGQRVQSCASPDVDAGGETCVHRLWCSRITGAKEQRYEPAHRMGAWVGLGGVGEVGGAAASRHSLSSKRSCLLLNVCPRPTK